MSKAEKRIQAFRDNPDDVRFDDLCAFAERVGFSPAKGGGTSHRVYRHPGPPAQMVNIQRKSDGKAKGYQVREFLKAYDRLFPETEP